MPVKKRSAKRRFDFQTLLDAWEMPLTAGRDFFRELPTIGVGVDSHGRPDLVLAEEAWRQFGPTLLANRGPKDGPTWAERTFGRPWLDAPDGE